MLWNDIKPAEYCLFPYNHFKSNGMVWYLQEYFTDLYYFSRDFYKVEKSNKTGFFSSLDICEHFFPVQVILNTMD